MRISKKHELVNRQNITLNNREQQNTNSFEEFCHHKLGPDFYNTKLWSESLLQDK